MDSRIADVCVVQSWQCPTGALRQLQLKTNRSCEMGWSAHLSRIRREPTRGSCPTGRRRKSSPANLGNRLFRKHGQHWSGGDGFGVGFASPEKVTAVSFTLAVNKDAASSCGGYLSYGWAGAGFFGRYFNPTDAHDGPLGDIAASVSVDRLSADPPGSLSVDASIVRCGDKTPSCDTQISLSSQTLGYVQLGSNNTFSVAWDQANHQFIFQLNSDSPVPLTYAEADTFPPGLQDKSFWVAGNVPHCTTRPRPSAAIDALFDNLYVNR